MPYAVSKWGYSPDPRAPDFGPVGYEFGAFPPYRWVSKTTDAEGIYAFLNEDYLWSANAQLPNRVRYVPVTPEPGIFPQELNIFGTNEPAGGPPTFTIRCKFELFRSFEPEYAVGEEFETYPYAIQEKSIDVVAPGTGAGGIPNPLVFTPAKWNFELP